MTDDRGAKGSDQSSSVLRRAFLKIEDLQAKLDAIGSRQSEPLALIGYGCRLPGEADSPAALWSFLADGRDAVGDIPPDRWDVDALFDPEPAVPGKTYTRRGGFIRNVDQFDPAFFGISPREAVRLDPQQRLLLELAWEALEHAGIAPLSLRGSATGVYVGQATYDYAQLQVKAGDPRALDAYFATGTAPSVASGRLSYTLGLQGPALTLDTACSSSLVALHLACQALRRRECDLALVGGVNLILSPDTVIAMCQSRMMAPDGRCKTYDAAADGFGQAEGGVVVVVKRLSDAMRDGDDVLAVVRGSAINQDGASSGLTAPSGPAQEAVIRAAFKDAGLSPEDASYVETHGTGTTLGDPIEVRAIAAAFGRGRPVDQPVLIGSIKTNLGHLEAAAGVAGLLKVVLSLQHQMIPAHLHFRHPNPFIEWDAIAVRVVDRLVAFPQINGRRIAGLSAFGFSGTNAHIVIEDAPPRPPAGPSSAGQRPHLLTLSARGEPAQRDVVNALRSWLRQNPAVDLGDVAFAANAGRSPSTHRLTLMAESLEQADAQLGRFLAGEPDRGMRSATLENADPPRIAYLFTGQGAQYLGMGSRLYDEQPVFRASFDDCDARFSAYLNGSIADVLYRSRDAAAAEALNRTGWTQPALFALEYALAKMWQSWGIEPSLVIGHSLGEYTAACVSGVMSLDDAVRLVAARATLIGRLPQGGAMAAVMADEAQVTAGLAAFPQVSLAAVNGPRSAVISGPSEAVTQAEQRFKAEGLATVRLEVSHAFHSSLLDPMLPEFEAAADSVALAEPVITFVSTLSGKALRPGTLTRARYWREQTRGTVRFADALRAAYGLGYRVFVELGPKPVLTSFAAQTLGEDCLCVSTLAEGQSGWETALDALGRLYLKGAVVDWRGVARPRERPRLALPTYPFQRSRFWLDPPRTRIAQAGPTARDPSRHPHLTRRTDTALGEIVFETRLDLAQHPYFNDHRVQGVAVLPTAFYLDLVASGLSEAVQTQGARLDNMVIHRAASIPDDGLDLQLLIGARTSAGTVQVFGRGAEGWILVFSGTFDPNAGPGLPLQEEPSTGRGPELGAIDVASFYTALHRIGLEFGPSFHRVVDLRRQGDAATGEISPIPGQGFGLHPAVLDGCLQTLAAALPGFDPDTLDTDVYMPIGIDRFELIRPWDGPLRSHARFEPVAEALAGSVPEVRVGHVVITDASGQLVARVTGIHMKRAAARAQRSPALDEHLYRIEWQRAEPDRSGAQPSSLASFDWSASTVSLAASLRVLAEQHGLAVQAALEPALDALCTGYVLAALVELGWWGEVGASLAASDLIARTAPAHRRLVDRLLQMLAEDGILQRQADDDRWLVLKTMRPREAPDAAPLIDRFPTYRPEILFAERGGVRLAEALRGEVQAPAVLFPNGSFALADELYRHSPAALTFNQLASQAVTDAVRAAPQSRPIRILEVGGGTGGVTSAILPGLTDRASYVFTDLSPTYFRKAARDFAAFPFVRFEVLDIEKPPEEQGFEGQSFDLVIASNVLHATDRLAQALDHVRSLLAPGGQLLLLEGLKASRWIDLSFGLTAGWWKFTDTDLRPDYPLLSADTWRHLLIEKGFSEPVLTTDAGILGQATQGLLLARLERPVPVRGVGHKAEMNPLIFADAAGAARRLCARLEALGSSCTTVHADSRFEHEAGRTLVDPDDPAHYQALFDALKTAGRRPGAILFLWPIDVRLAADAPADALDAQLKRCCGSLLLLLQAYARAGSEAPTIWIVTQAAQSVVPGDRLDGLVQSALLGLAKVAALELPEVAFRRLDLERLEDVDALAEDIADRSGEPIMAMRGGQRYIARLVPLTAAPPSRTRPDEGRELQIVERGSFEGLSLRPVRRATLGRHDVEIEVMASGLNFRDVLNVLGARADDSPLGGEVSGVVTRLGPDVRDLMVGQAVVAVTSGGLADFATASAALVLPKPDKLGWVEAAASPLAFLTAHYALTVIGGMQAGERVLIHAGAGGVGMAAIQLAQQAGLAVFATAGSQAKRDRLAALGLRGVYDSRKLDFAADLMRDSGGAGVDLVLSAVTGPAIAAGLALLGAGGRYLEIGKAEILTDAAARAINPGARYHVVDLADLIVREPAEVRVMFAEIVAKLASGSLQPLPVTSFPLNDAHAAFEHLARARHVGKVVLTVGDERPSRTSPDAGRTLALKADATYLISGGLTGLGLASAQRLVERGARHLVLFGRRAPSPDATVAIEAMRAAGATIVARQADVTCEADLRGLFDGPLRAAPPLAGIIHAAGRLEDGVLMQQTWSRFADVLGPKARGAWLLHRLSADMPLDFFVLYSSVSAILGAPGQANHAAANAFLDGLAAYRQARQRPGLSLNWGSWAEIGAAADTETTQRLSKRGVEPLSVAEGLAAFEALLSRPAGQVSVIRADWTRIADALESQAERPFLSRLAAATTPVRETGTRAVAGELRQAPAEQRGGLLSALVRAQVVQVLGGARTQVVSDHQPFREMGLDSLMALELRAGLTKALDLATPLPATLAFDHTTIDTLVDYLMKDVLGWTVSQTPPAAADGDRPLIATIEQMSDDEVERLLARRGARVG